MRRLLSALALTSCLLVPLTAGGAAAGPVKIKFTLDWKLQGIHAWYFWAKAKGYFTAENLDVTIDQGEGSAATVTRVMSGAYDAGFGDINAIIQNAATRPAETPRMVYMIYSKAPFALLSKASDGASIILSADIWCGADRAATFDALAKQVERLAGSVPAPISAAIRAGKPAKATAGGLSFEVTPVEVEAGACASVPAGQLGPVLMKIDVEMKPAK